MKLKTLLLGSAATLIAVSGARAADAVVAEPEPVDYVKVCDMYGAGFFYIPGTETCLKISGEVRVQYEYQNYDSDGYIHEWQTTEITTSLTATSDPSQTTNHDHHGSAGDAYWHARVNFDAREETDWGTLATYIRLDGASDNASSAQSSWGALDAHISLGGFSTGYRTSRHELTGLLTMTDGYYFSGGRMMYFDYTYAANGLAVIGGIAIDNDSLGDSHVGNTSAQESIDPYIRADYSGSMFNIGAVYSHDTSASEGAWGVYGNIMPMEGLTIQAHYNSQDASTAYGGATGDTQMWGISAKYALMDNVAIAAGYSETDSDAGDSEIWTATVDWNVTNNLVVRFGYAHEDVEGAEVDDYRIRIQSNF